MKLVSNLKGKTIGETEVGEWFRIDTHDGPILGWVTGKRDDKGRDVVIFYLEGQKPPSFMPWTSDRFCLSVGTECVIEPLDVTAAFASTSEFYGQPGVLTVNATGSYITAGDRSGGWQDFVEINIETGELREDGKVNGALFREWRLWSSDADRLSPKREPLLTFSIALPG